MGYKISYYDHEAKKLAWRDDASENEYLDWMAKRAKKNAGKRTSPSKVTSEPLEDSGSPPEHTTGPKRKGGPNTRPESVLAPALPRLAQAIAQLTFNLSHSLTGGRATMTQQEATYVAVPAVRILDRTAAKYVKSTGVTTPNQEDAAVIVITVAMWALGWLIAVLTKKPRGAPQVTHVSNIPQQTVNDLFSGSEPVSPNGAPAAPAPPAAVDEGDLFSGSEPLAADGSATMAAAGPRTDPRAAAVAEAVWQAITPTDRGEALAG